MTHLWVVHPRACGGCGAKALTARGLGPCERCGWEKPEEEKTDLAIRLDTEPDLAARLDEELS